MIKVSVLYPNTSELKFDMDYYRAKHVPLVLERCGTALQRGEIDRGLAGGAPGSPPEFFLAAHLVFDSMDAMQGSMGQHLPELLGDIPNFSNVQPTIQISEIIL